MEKLYKLTIDWLPFIILAIPLSLLLYTKYGNPTEAFFDTLNIIGAWILVSPLLLLVLGAFLNIVDAINNPESKEISNCCKCCECCKYHCCCKHKCCKGEK